MCHVAMKQEQEFYNGGGFFAFRANQGNNSKGRGLRLLTQFTNRNGKKLFVLIYKYIFICDCEIKGKQAKDRELQKNQTVL